MRKKFIHAAFPFSLSAGYTFIELLVVFSIMGIIGAVSIASFVRFTNSQSVNSAATDVVSVYTTARQRALSQIKPEQCTSAQSLSSYRVIINLASGSYALNAVCGSLIVPISSENLPAQINFNSGTTTVVDFNLPSGTLTKPAVISITGYGKTKTITISSSGSVSVQ